MGAEEVPYDPDASATRQCYYSGMDGPLLIATASLAGVVILAVVGLATLIVNVGRGIRRDLTARMDDLAASQGEMRERMDGLAASQGEIRERMARLEGLLEGLREAVSGRRAA